MTTITPSRKSILAVTPTTAFLRAVAETEAIRLMEDRLELDSLVTGDPAYHPLGDAYPLPY
jgi:hypothetical protein